MCLIIATWLVCVLTWVIRASHLANPKHWQGQQAASRWYNLIRYNWSWHGSFLSTYRSLQKLSCAINHNALEIPLLIDHETRNSLDTFCLSTFVINFQYIIEIIIVNLPMFLFPCAIYLLYYPIALVLLGIKSQALGIRKQMK